MNETAECTGGIGILVFLFASAPMRLGLAPAAADPVFV